MEAKPLNGFFINHASQKQFQNRFRALIEELENLSQIFSEVTNIAVANREINHQEQVFYSFINTIWDDFMEIIILYANGFPLGAMKILRGMFERTVHIRHFLHNPEDIELFWDYVWIDERKMARFLPSRYSPEDIEIINKRAKEVESKFEVPICVKCKKEDCEDCKKKRISHAWSGKRDIVSMAEKSGLPKELIYFSYYLPLQENHPKLQSIVRRHANEIDDSIEYDQNSDSIEKETVLLCSHQLLLIAFDSFMKFFNISNNELKMEKLNDSYSKVWSKIRLSFRNKSGS